MVNLTKEIKKVNDVVINSYYRGLEQGLKEGEKKIKALDKLANKYAKMIELMSDGMSYDKAKEEVKL